MSDELVNLEVRLSALEIFICYSLSKFLDENGQDGSMDRLHLGLLNRLERVNVKTLSPMYEDGDIDNLAYAIRCLVSMQRRIMRMPARPQAEPSRPAD